MSADLVRINNTLGKFALYLSNHNSICVSVSGGSDSDIIVHIIATYMREFLHKVHFVNVNTGLEYQATKDHLKYLEQRYNIQIERIRGKSVVWAIKHYGVPVLSKNHSQFINAYIKGVPWALRYYDDVVSGKCAKDEINRNVKKRIITPQFLKVLEEVHARGLQVSNKCCDISKKKPLYDFIKAHGIDLNVTGERRAEGGMRAVTHTNCFEAGNHGVDKYMPLFFWDDDTKAYYKEAEGIRYSDCYEVWGMKRTGCVGCPYNSKVGQELKLVEKYEPRMAQACKNVFGDSYRLIDECWNRKDKIFPEYEQISVFDVLNEVSK